MGKKLSIQINLNGLSFCIKHQGSITWTTKEQFPKKLNPQELLPSLKNAFAKYVTYMQNFDEVQIIHQNELSALVPKPFFRKDFLAEYLKYNARILPDDFMTFDEIEGIDTMNVYVPYTNINNYIFDAFGSFQYKHSGTVLIETFTKLNKDHSGCVVYIHASHGFFEMTYFQNNQLQMYNWFSFDTPSDFTYYVLFALEQLGINKETCLVYFSGSIKKESEIFSMIYKFVRHVQILEPPIPKGLKGDNKDLLVSENLILLYS